MSDRTATLEQLITLSRTLGDPALDCAILGEGNTSALVDDKTFYVKASGTELRTAEEKSFVSVALPRALEVLNGPDLNDAQVRDALVYCKTDSSAAVMPSVETFLHGYLLSLPDINFVGHTHPTAVNAIMSSKNVEQIISGKLFPDEIVCCGPAVCFVKYTDPGIALAKYLRSQVEAFIDKYDMPPRVILMQNHGLIATGATIREVINATMMYVKTARVLAGAAVFGGANYLTPENVARIHNRPDEHYRQKLLRGQ